MMRIDMYRRNWSINLSSLYFSLTRPPLAFYVFLLFAFFLDSTIADMSCFLFDFFAVSKPYRYPTPYLYCFFLVPLQDPVMFCGSMRENLDPFGRCDDVTIWAALEAARLSQYVSGLEGKLDAEASGAPIL